MSNPEHTETGGNFGIEASKSANERLETLNNRHESGVESSHDRAETKAEKARNEALESAVSVESGGVEKDKSVNNSAPVRRGRISKKQLNNSYKQTISRVQNEMSPANRLFSKVIHNKVIENTSEVIGNTIARPNAILSGAIVAFVLTLAVYTVSKTNGYVMSGFETVGAFIIGWTIGITYDYLRLLFTGKKY